MKKIIACFLVLITAINFIPSIYAAESEADYDDSIGALIAFGIITGEVSDIDQRETLTREKAALWIYRALGLKTEYSDSVFSDVQVGSAYANAALALAEREIISGYPDGRFYPNNPISYTDFITILVNLLEYGRAAEIYGGYPSGYIKTAGNLKLSKGTSSTSAEKLSVGEAAQIFYNALKTEMLDTEKPLLEALMEIYTTEGRVLKDSKTSLAFPEGVSENKIMIDDTVYIADGYDGEYYLGKNVTAFYTEKDGTEKIVHLELDGKFEEITIKAEDIVKEKSDRTELIYELNNKEYRLKISPVADIIYNGKAYPDLAAEKLYPECGEIRLLDSDNDGKYDVLFVTSYETIYVSNIIEYSKTVFNKYTGEGFISEISFDDNSETDFYDAYGETMEFNDIASGNILLVAASETGAVQYYRAVISDIVKKGTVREVSEEYIVADDVEYEKSSFLERAVGAGKLLEPELNCEYYFYLDVYGAVAAYEKIISGNQYGYLKRAYTDIDTDESYVKIFTQDNTWETFRLKDKVVLDGEPYTAEALTAVVNTNIMVRYQVDSARRIKTIETPVLTSASDEKLSSKIKTDTFRKAQVNNLKYYTMNKSFESTFFAEADAKVFLIPTAAGASEDDFKRTDMSYFVSESRYTVDVYDIDEYMFSEILVIEYDSSSASTLTASLGHNDYCMMVDKVMQIYVDDEVVSYVSGITKGQEWSYTSSEADTFKKLRRGDIIRTKYDDSGKLKHYITVHSVGTEDLTSNVTDVNNSVYIFGRVLAVDYEKNRIRINQGSELTITATNSPYVTIYDAGSNEIRAGSLQDLRPDDYAVFRMRTSVPYEIFVIKE